MKRTAYIFIGVAVVATVVTITSAADRRSKARARQASSILVPSAIGKGVAIGPGDWYREVRSDAKGKIVGVGPLQVDPPFNPYEVVVSPPKGTEIDEDAVPIDDIAAAFRTLKPENDGRDATFGALKDPDSPLVFRGWYLRIRKVVNVAPTSHFWIVTVEVLASTKNRDGSHFSVSNYHEEEWRFDGNDKAHPKLTLIRDHADPNAAVRFSGVGHPPAKGR
jgi:hypothetical protein